MYVPAKCARVVEETPRREYITSQGFGSGKAHRVNTPDVIVQIDGLIRVVVVLGFTTLLTSQVISVAFYSERQKSEKFCSEALISA